ncbi:hypothetical protein [Balneicella halophila]|uniref:hypothetical protein n=1 Tax=Balneicella halophila TaxID=1537566 RepID=UPI0010577FE3|nr:hypothetical protein [Balneicella halophila]
MKTIIKYIIVTILLICTGNSYAQTRDKNIQEQVLQTFIKAQENKDSKNLLELNDKLEQQYNDHQQKIFKYWQAYSEYYTAIYYISQNDKKTQKNMLTRQLIY